MGGMTIAVPLWLLLQRDVQIRSPPPLSRAGFIEIMLPARWLPASYFTHFQATSPFVAGLVHVSSSPAVSEVIVRFCCVPSKFGYVLPSMRIVRVLSGSLTV